MLISNEPAIMPESLYFIDNDLNMLGPQGYGDVPSLRRSPCVYVVENTVNLTVVSILIVTY